MCTHAVLFLFYFTVFGGIARGHMSFHLHYALLCEIVLYVGMYPTFCGEMDRFPLISVFVFDLQRQFKSKKIMRQNNWPL